MEKNKTASGPVARQELPNNASSWNTKSLNADGWQVSTGKLNKGIVVVAFVTIFLAIVVVGSARELRNARIEFERFSQVAFDHVRSAFDIVEGVLASVRAVPSTSIENNLVHSEMLSRSVLGDYRFVVGMGRYEAVDEKHSELFVQALQPHRADFRLWQYQRVAGDNYVAVPAITRRAHYPVIYAASREGSAGSLVGFDLASEGAFEKALRETVFSEQASMSAIPAEWQGNGQLLVFRSAGENIENESRPKGKSAGYWLELDLESMLATKADWRQLVGYGVELIFSAFEYDVVSERPRSLLSVPAPVNDLLFSELFQSNNWSGAFSVGGHTLRVNFSRQGGLTLSGLLLHLTAAALLVSLLLVIYLLNVRRRVAIVERQAQLSALHRTQQRASVTLESIGDAVLTIDTNSNVVYANPAAASLLGVRYDKLMHRPVTEVLRYVDERANDGLINCDGHDVELPQPPLALDMSKQTSAEYHISRADGSRVTVNQTNSPLYDLQGQQSGNVLVLRDISIERELTRALQHQANHDPLTGVANRLRFEEVIAELFDKEKPDPRGHAICYADLDKFKAVNDTCGHAAGDELLIKLVEGLRGQVRDQDLIARLGGDEFAIVIRDCPELPAESVIARVYDFFQSFHFHHSGHVFPVRASIGLVHFHPEQSNATDVLTIADAACYEAKRAGRNCVRKQSVGQVCEQVNCAQGVSLEQIRDALQQDDFELQLQVLADVSQTASTVFGHAYQLTLTTSDGVIFNASEISSIAARHSLMVQLDHWLIENVLARYSELQLENRPAPLILINLSAASLKSIETIEVLESALACNNHLSADRVCFDVSEDTLLQDFAVGVAGLERLRLVGCQTSLADFGSGVSSLGRFAELPVDYIKIDSSVLENSSDIEARKKMLGSLHGFASGLGVNTIVTGIDNDARLQYCRSVGIRYLQGSVFSSDDDSKPGEVSAAA